MKKIIQHGDTITESAACGIVGFSGRSTNREKLRIHVAHTHRIGTNRRPARFYKVTDLLEFRRSMK